ncbi:hypothetical protein BsWGS_00202 [Bradybaena similaris]
MYVNVDSKRSIRFIDGWLELQIADNSWQRYWCVLRDDVIILFNSQKETKDATVGTIAIGPESRLEKLGGDERLGYTFRLCTKRINYFKTAKAIDLEMWKAYVEGIAHGDVCDDLDLLPGLIEDVRIKLKQFHMNKLPARIPNKVSPAGVGDLKSGFDTPDGSTSGSYDTSGYLYPHPYEKRPSINYGTQKYRFYSDPSKTDVPNWFFSSCSRELAESILTVAGAYGNTLIRENNNDTKNLRISKRTESSSGHVFTHYIIQVSPLGYKIDVENPHEPKQTLSEVMEFFIDTSGRSTTRPMTCNDLKLFGLGNYNYNDYNTKIVTTHHDADSGEDIADGEASGSSSRSFCISPPASAAPPPPPHLKTSKPAYSKGPLGVKGSRSTSVPNMQVPVFHSEQSPAAKQSQTLSKSSGIQSSHILRTNVKEERENLVPPRLPAIAQKTPTSPHQNVPPLPPNHPPPLQKANSQSAIKVTPDILNTTTKKGTSKHTQSVSSADMQVRKISPRDQQAALQARDELAHVTARIIKQTEPPEVLPKATEPAKSGIQIEALKSPAGASDSFKKKLEGIIGNPHAQAAKLQAQGETDDPDGYYESLLHYQNVSEIQNNRK